MKKSKKITLVSIICFFILLTIAGFVIFFSHINKTSEGLAEETENIEEAQDIQEESENIEDIEEKLEESDYSDTELYGEPYTMSDITESATFTSFNDDVLSSETSLPQSAIWTLPYQLDEFLIKNHPDYSSYPGFFEYIDDSFWEKDDNSIMFIRIQSEDYPGIYLDCGYYEESEHWAFTERSIEDLPANHHRYKYSDNPLDNTEEEPSIVYDPADEITVTEK